MATETKTNPTAESFENAAERLTGLADKAAANGRKATTTYLSSYENAVVTIADSYEKAAGASRVEWLATVAAAQADFTREITKAYTAAARELVG